MKPKDTKKTVILYSSNGIRLNIRQCIFVAVFCVTMIMALPHLWKKVEKFSPGEDYRLPYQLGSDYWLYDHYSEIACSKYETVLIGDSVVWGHYVAKNKTLSHYLNELKGQDEFANLGVDGMHPAALEGLLRYYGKDIKNKNVILHLNLLWMSSPKHDLQTDKDFRFNHPRLVSQFKTKIPCYKAPFSSRLNIALERYFTFPAWVSHLNIAYFNNTNIPAWTMENPYQNPLSAIDPNLLTEIPKKTEDTDDNEQSNKSSGGDFQWVKADTSLQWKFFRNTLNLLKERGNKIVVMIGPFNEHMLSGESLDNYQELKSDIEKWFEQNNISFISPPALSSEFYNDASHPTAQGYKILAQELIDSNLID